MNSIYDNMLFLKSVDLFFYEMEKIFNLIK